MVVGQMGQGWEGVLFPNADPSLFSNPQLSQLRALYSRFSLCFAIVSQQTQQRAGMWAEGRQEEVRGKGGIDFGTASSHLCIGMSATPTVSTDFGG